MKLHRSSFRKLWTYPALFFAAGALPFVGPWMLRKAGAKFSRWIDSKLTLDTDSCEDCGGMTLFLLDGDGDSVLFVHMGPCTSGDDDDREDLPEPELEVEGAVVDIADLLQKMGEAREERTGTGGRS